LATSQLNSHANPWIWGRPTPPTRRLGDHLIDLSAVVEDVDGRSMPGLHQGLLRRRARTAVRPLLDVLSNPDTDLILLQAGPGASKSVALRRHAMSQLQQMTDDENPSAPLPLYGNLRELKAGPHEINTSTLQRYIQTQTGPRGSTDRAAHFERCFTDDLRSRRVTLLLDSFDEIPAVLDSPTVDVAVAPYIQTVIELVGGGGRCMVGRARVQRPLRVGLDAAAAPRLVLTTAGHPSV
jgi:hypothetical protein